MAVRYACDICGQDPAECEHDFGKRTTFLRHAPTTSATSVAPWTAASTKSGRSTASQLGDRSWTPIFAKSPSYRAHAIRSLASSSSPAQTDVCVSVTGSFRRQTACCCATTACIPARASAAATYVSQLLEITGLVTTLAGEAA
jgi:hypothetical protein